jgi:hypothetical protein
LSNAYVRDLWEHSDLGSKSLLAVSIPPHGCKIYRISATPAKITSPQSQPVRLVHLSGKRYAISGAGRANIKVYTLQGVQLFSVEKASGNQFLDLSDLQTGIYVVQAVRENTLLYAGKINII